MTKSPSFKSNSELARYIPPEDQNKDHAALTAFLLSSKDRAHSSGGYLSVDAVEMVKLKHLAERYRQLLEPSAKTVAICTNKVQQYMNGAAKAGINFTKEAERGNCFTEDGETKPAFLHRPNMKPVEALSHCGVEFVRCLSARDEVKFARYMASRPKFHKIK